MHLNRVGQHGWVVIPVKIRKQLGIQQGDYVSVELGDNKEIIIKQTVITESSRCRHVPSNP